MNAKEAAKISDRIQNAKNKSQLEAKQKQAETLYYKASIEFPTEMKWIYKRIKEYSEKGEKSDSFFPTDNPYLREMILKDLRKNGYKASISWQQYDDDGNGNDTLSIEW